MYPRIGTSYDHSLIERFERKIRIRGSNECWPWTGARAGGRDGEYGVFSFPRPRKDRQVYAHRFGYCVANGLHIEDIKGFEILHTCDTPLCENPRHFIKGTHTDNVRDMQAKGRQGQYGKLSLARAREVKQRLSHGDRVKDISQDFKVSHSAISHIKRGKVWKSA